MPSRRPASPCTFNWTCDLNSGRMLWMTQPAWPSNTWQILNADYDTQSSFYAVKKACEPLHVQLDLRSEQRTHVVDDSACMAQQHLADSERGLRHAIFFLCRQEGLRAPARSTGPAI